MVLLALFPLGRSVGGLLALMALALCSPRRLLALEL
ncbi:MAG: hypothetical protein QOH38_400, partial [Thermoleophilaceae bacterium]|nr:hypothetical protein [Thermoleophilaceae bacterium]